MQRMVLLASKVRVCDTFHGTVVHTRKGDFVTRVSSHNTGTAAFCRQYVITGNVDRYLAAM